MESLLIEIRGAGRHCGHAVGSRGAPQSWAPCPWGPGPTVCLPGTSNRCQFAPSLVEKVLGVLWAPDPRVQLFGSGRGSWVSSALATWSGLDGVHILTLMPGKGTLFGKTVFADVLN